MGTSSSRPRKARDSLSPEIILKAAETVAERDGLDNLTFQAIGKELSAHPTSVYRHFRDKDELVLELIDSLRARSYGEELAKLVPSDDWREDLRQVARRVHKHYMRYPEFALSMASRTTRRPMEFSNVEFTLGVLQRAGLDDESAALYLRAFGNMNRAMSSMEASMSVLPEKTRQADAMAWQVEYRQLPEDKFPRIAAAREHLQSIDDPRIFDVAIDLMIEGIAQRAAEIAARTSAEG